MNFEQKQILRPGPGSRRRLPPSRGGPRSDDGPSNRYRVRRRLETPDSPDILRLAAGPARQPSLSLSLRDRDRDRMMTTEGLQRSADIAEAEQITLAVLLFSLDPRHSHALLAILAGAFGLVSPEAECNKFPGSRPCRASGLGFTSLRIPYGSQDRLVGGSAAVGQPRAHSGLRAPSAIPEIDEDSAGENISYSRNKFQSW